VDEIKTIQFGGAVPLNLFSFRCELEDYENKWEIEYVRELIATLKEGMTVYDIGAESGELSVLAGKIVGGGNVHLIEPNKDYFPNIKAIWLANSLPYPANCFNGYVYERSSENVVYGELDSLGNGDIFHGCLHPNNIDSPMQTVCLDDYCKTFRPPNVVMMDIEGAELSVVRGAKDVIDKYQPIFFISIHKPFFIDRISNGRKEDLMELFFHHGYEAIHLATDHEEHWKFIKK
jgi:FkbM family methyltransferase